MMEYRKKLFDTYHLSHISNVDASEASKLEWFLKYFKKYYLPFIDFLNRESSYILEIGCNKGFMLSALRVSGFRNLYGIDLSTMDLEIARKIVPEAQIYCADAFTFLENHAQKFDAILIKAVLEHIEKEKILLLLDKIKEGLRPGGVAIIDVPNMDWLFASHERYFDFTHEVGFTPESLRQLMNNVFADVMITTADNIFKIAFMEDIKRKMARLVLGKLLSWADGQGGTNAIWHRSIIGVGKK